MNHPNVEFSWPDRIRRGDDSAFIEILERFRRPIFDFCWRLLQDAGEAEDVAQETFVRAYGHLKSGKATAGKLSTWLFLVARRQCIDRLRKRARQKTDSDPAPEAAHARTPRDEAILHELSEAIAAAVGGLPEDQRAALILAEYEGQSLRDIAAVMETSPKSVESRLYRARQFLRQRLAGWMTDDR